MTISNTEGIYSSFFAIIKYLGFELKVPAASSVFLVKQKSEDA